MLKQQVTASLYLAFKMNAMIYFEHFALRLQIRYAYVIAAKVPLNELNE